MTNGHITIKYQGRVWSAKATPAGRIFVTANNGASADVHESEATAHAWLGNHGLRRGRIRRLLDAALRGTGDYADENHPNRVKENGAVQLQNSD